MVRYMNAAHAAGYVGLSLTYNKKSFFDEFNKTMKFLTPKEYSRVSALDMDYSGACYKEITTWVMKEIALAENKGYVDSRLANFLRQKLLEGRGAMDSLYDYADQPIHFYYIHFLCLLSALYLPLFAISNACSAGVDENVHLSSDIINGVIVLVQAIFVIGLRLLGQQLVDPFGDDLEDLSVLHYVRGGWETSNRVLATHFPDDIDYNAEQKLDKSKAPLGPAWEADWKPSSETGGGIV